MSCSAKRGDLFYVTPSEDLPVGMILTVEKVLEINVYGWSVFWSDGTMSRLENLKDPEFGFWVTPEKLSELVKNAPRIHADADPAGDTD